MADFKKATDDFVGAIKKTEIYEEYSYQLNRIKMQPELKKKVDEFRQRNFVLQSSGEDLFEKSDAFEEEYAEFRENPFVADFLAAELAMCRLIQEINVKIAESIDISM